MDDCTMLDGTVLDGTILADLPVDDVMRRWPRTIGVFIAHRIGCVGCPIGPWHSVSDAARAHGIEPTTLAQKLLAAVVS